MNRNEESGEILLSPKVNRETVGTEYMKKQRCLSINRGHFL